jgi:predicted dehydrogenase
MLPILKRLPEIELIGIASASGASAQHAARRFGFRYAESSEKVIVDDPQVNAIAIFTRHHLHARQVQASLAAGKHVFCEKPLALNESELEEISLALQSAPGILMVGFNRRFAPLARRLMDFLSGRQEPLLAHYRVNAGFIPLSHWTQDPLQGGGRIIGEGCHFIDLLTFLVGAPPSAVTATALPDQDHYREDNVVLTFEFPDGSLGTLTYLANGDKAFPKERLEVFSAGRVAVLDDFRTLELVQDGRREVMHSRLRQDKGHLGEWQALTPVLRAGGPPLIPYDHIFGVTRASFAAVAALRRQERIQIS